ncbi:MAG: DNA polymerase/3'-5' exonuclease PolX [Anaerolineae bacterium]
MPVYNSDIAEIFDEVADLLDIEGANQFRVRAYRDAARTINTLSANVAEMVKEGEDLTELEGIGQDLAGKIREIVKTGGLEQLQEIRQRTPPELAEMLHIAGLGPKRVQKIHQELGVSTVEGLRRAAEQGQIEEIEGLGPKTQQQILEGIERLQDQKRTLLSVAEEFVAPLVDYVRDSEGVEKVMAAGSYRRRQETVGDLDILATGQDREAIIQRFVEYEDVDDVVSQGQTRSTVILRRGLQVDLRVVAQESYGAALLYFTGSKAHNIALRNLALDRGWKINEYGVFEDEERIAGETEEEIYELLDLDYVEPEMREDRGEIQLAREGKLPRLVTLDDLHGDLQSHTTSSDGHNSLEEMAAAAQERGYEYLAITDHSQYVGVTQGLDAEEVAKQGDEIDRLNDEFEGFRLLKAIEVDILEDGSLDLPDEALAKLDLVLCSVHSHFGLSRDKQTERIIRAMDNPYFNILAHPTGRRMGERDGYEVDMERLLDAALERGCFLEVNAQPDRLDLDDVYCKMAKERGLKLSISTDAHRTSELDFVHFGLGQARRGWLEPGDVLNTRSWSDLKKLLTRD